MRKRFVRPVLRQGIHASWDTSHGLVPCKVLSIFDSTVTMARIKLTSARGPYKRGEVIETSTTMVYPRDAVFTKNYVPRVLPYDVVKDAA